MTISQILQQGTTRIEELQPPKWLDLDITDCQTRLFAPKPKDIVREAVSNDTMGKGEKNDIILVMR